MDPLKELPLGFGMALIQNEQAMRRFEGMTEAERSDILKKTHTVDSKEEMQLLVNSLADGKVQNIFIQR